MSIAAKAEAETSGFVCDNCGIAEVDDVKLEECDGCGLVKYCSDKCREEHQELHSEECQIRVKELHDRKLFEQFQDRHHGDCPICFLPLPIDPRKSIIWTCCSNVICDGCVYATRKSSGGRSCPFCRTVAGKEDSKIHRQLMKRIKANDPLAMSRMGGECHYKGDYEGAFEYYTKAAKLGDSSSNYHLGVMYGAGQGVEKDEEKTVHHWEKAAIGGHPFARYNLGCIEKGIGNTERAVKHHVIAANAGYEISMQALWGHYSAGNITKEDLEATLRSHHAALDSMKSEQRGAAERAKNRSSK